MIQISNAETHAVYIRTHAHTIYDIRGCIQYTHEHLLLLVFENYLLKFLRFQLVKNKRLVNALNMSVIPPSHICTDTQAWDCYAKKLLATPLRLQRYEKKLTWTKKYGRMWRKFTFCKQNDRKPSLKRGAMDEKKEVTLLRM